MMLRYRIMFILSAIMLLELWFMGSALSQDPKLIARWPLDESSGDAVKDAVGGNDGEFRGGKLKWEPAKFGNGLQFDGAGSYVEIPKTEELESPDSVTLVAWVNFAAVTGRQEIVSYSDNYATSLWDGVLHAFIHQGGGWPIANGKTPVKANEWYFVAMTYDSKDVKLYVNGKFDGSIAAPGKIDYQAFPLWLGGGPADNSFWLNGILDEVEIWDRAMTENEIMEIYQSPPISSAVNWRGKMSITWGELKSQ